MLRLIHCTPDVLIPEISPNVGNLLGTVFVPSCENSVLKRYLQHFFVFWVFLKAVFCGVTCQSLCYRFQRPTCLSCDMCPLFLQSNFLLGGQGWGQLGWVILCVPCILYSVCEDIQYCTESSVMWGRKLNSQSFKNLCIYTQMNLLVQYLQYSVCGMLVLHKRKTAESQVVKCSYN